MKVGFLGNCQAQALESWSMQATDALSVVTFPPVWLIEEDHVGRIIADIESCDYVFAQRLSDDFPRSDLATSRLKERYGGKLISWPNAYFDGYFPGLSYRYSVHGRVHGPLDEYHWDPIEADYRAGRSVTECAMRLESEAIFERFPDPVGHSLCQLADREAGLDVIISDYVATHLQFERLFFSMNHPVIPVLRELLDRMFGEVGERRRLAALGPFGYPLDKIILPVLPAIRKRHRIAFGSGEPIKGVRLIFGGDGYEVTDKAQLYSTAGLVEAFYRVYACNEANHGNQQ